MCSDTVRHGTAHLDTAGKATAFGRSCHSIYLLDEECQGICLLDAAGKATAFGQNCHGIYLPDEEIKGICPSGHSGCHPDEECHGK